MSNSQLNKLKSEIKNSVEVTLNFKFQECVILLQMIYQLRKFFLKFICQRWFNWEDFFFLLSCLAVPGIILEKKTSKKIKKSET